MSRPAVDDDGLRALAVAATPGPWAPYFTSHGDPMVVLADRGWFGAITDPIVDDDVGLGIMARVSTSPSDYGRANAEYMGAVGPDVVLGLLDEVSALRQQLAGTQPVIEAAEAVTNAHQQWGERYCLTDVRNLLVPAVRAWRAAVTEVAP